MFKQLRLWSNILLGMAVAIVPIITVLTLINQQQLQHEMLESETFKLQQFAGMIQLRIQSESRLGETLGVLVANIPEVQKRFAAGDRDWLRTQFLPAYHVLAARYGVTQFQFHTPPATSFLRLHMPEKYGDDLSSLRYSVVATNTQGVPQHGLEVGVADLGARGVVPILQQNKALGSVEFGLSFGPSFFTTFKKNHGVDAGLHLLREGTIKTFSSTAGEQPLLNATAIQAALKGHPQLQRMDMNGIPLAVYGEAVQDYSGKVIGVIEVAMDRSHTVMTLSEIALQGWLIGGLAILFSLTLALIAARLFTRRLKVLGSGMERVAAGDLTVHVQLDGRDELADLARVANRMRERLHILVSQVETNARAVYSSSGEIAQAVDGQAATSTQMSASVAEITSTMEELSASSTQIAEYSGSVVEIARRTYDESLQGTAAMQRLVTRMEEIRRDNQTSLKDIIALGSTSKEISKIMDIIDTVADQTKLIAFNAAIEAARAGEQGRGFAVVAAEIRRLADSVIESTSEIARKVEAIQESIGRLVIVSEKGAVGIEQGLGESTRAAEFLRALVQAANESASSAQQISLSTQQQKTASNQVVVALREIVAASSDTAYSVRHIAQVAQNMTQLSAQLTTQVDRFTLAVPASSHTTTQEK